MVYFNCFVKPKQTFHIKNVPFLSSNIPSSPAYGVFISQHIWYARDCSSYECFILSARRLSYMLLKQGYLVEHLKSSFRKFYGLYGDFIQQYEVSLLRMLNDILTLDQHWLLNRSDFPPILWPWYRAWPSPNYEWVPLEHLQRVWHANLKRISQIFLKSRSNRYWSIIFRFVFTSFFKHRNYFETTLFG